MKKGTLYPQQNQYSSSNVDIEIPQTALEQIEMSSRGEKIKITARVLKSYHSADEEKVYLKEEYETLSLEDFGDIDDITVSHIDEDKFQEGLYPKNFEIVIEGIIS